MAASVVAGNATCAVLLSISCFNLRRIDGGDCAIYVVRTFHNTDGEGYRISLIFFKIRL